MLSHVNNISASEGALTVSGKPRLCVYGYPAASVVQPGSTGHNSAMGVIPTHYTPTTKGDAWETTSADNGPFKGQAEVPQPMQQPMQYRLTPSSPDANAVLVVGLVDTVYGATVRLSVDGVSHVVSRNSSSTGLFYLPCDASSTVELDIDPASHGLGALWIETKNGSQLAFIDVGSSADVPFDAPWLWWQLANWSVESVYLHLPDGNVSHSGSCVDPRSAIADTESVWRARLGAGATWKLPNKRATRALQATFDSTCW